MAKKDINELLVKLASLDAKLDSVVDMLKKHDEHLLRHDSRLRQAEKHLNIAFGWAGAVGFCLSMFASWLWNKLCN
jgi:hypothetical protein